MDEEQASFIHLNYPLYLMTLLGIWEFLGVIPFLIPKFLLVKEWAYPGFFFMMSGAVISPIANEDEATTLLAPILLLILTIISWCFRPAERNITLLILTYER